MRWAFIHLLWIVATFPIAWTLAFAAVTGADFQLYFQYLDLTWHGTGGDLVGAVLIAALVLTGIFWGVFLVSRIIWLAYQKSRAAT